ncbi:MAG: DUF695 domain-containing protein [Eubacteriales bacterium]|nr:DUF695 domain-containing protein [Eubacteriales bacterium]
MTDWLTYEWEWKHRRATFKVDLQYWDLLPVLAYSQLVYVSCAPSSPLATSFSRSEEHRLAALRHTLSSQLNGHAVFVGSIRLDDLEQLYFYTADSTIINHMSGICRLESKLRTTCGHSDEPHYATYYRLLFPDDSKLQSVENNAYIEAIAKQGGDLTLVRRIELEMAFLYQEDLDDFKNRIPRGGFTVGESSIRAGVSHPHRLLIYGYCTLNLAELNRFTSHAIEIAAQYDGLLERLSAAYIKN